MTTARQARLGRPASFERDALVAVARELGPGRLALRTVAEALDVPRTTVYNHVRSPEQLGQIVLASIMASAGDIDVEPTFAEGWEAELEVFALRQRAILLAAGPWMRYYDPHVHTSFESLRSADHLIGTLVASGFSPEIAGRATLLVMQLVEASGRTQGRVHSSRDDGEDYVRQLSEDEFPWIAAARTVAHPEADEQQFRFNLRCVLAGIASVVDAALPD